jgi:hypothetical protein
MSTLKIQSASEKEFTLKRLVFWHDSDGTYLRSKQSFPCII